MQPWKRAKRKIVRLQILEFHAGCIYEMENTVPYAKSKLRDQPQDPIREEMLATWTEQARWRIPDAIRQAWSIVIAVNDQNDIHAFKITVGADPLFSTVKAAKRSRR